jgi:hypothetical protein
MEVIDPKPLQKKILPNSSTILVLGILSIIPFCAIVGLILGIIGLAMSREPKLMYEKNPDAYIGYGNLNAGRILCIIGIVYHSIIALILLLGFLGIATFVTALLGFIGI